MCSVCQAASTLQEHLILGCYHVLKELHDLYIEQTQVWSMCRLQNPGDFQYESWEDSWSLPSPSPQLTYTEAGPCPVPTLIGDRSRPDQSSLLHSSSSPSAGPDSALRYVCVYRCWQNPEELFGPLTGIVEVPFLYSPQTPTPIQSSLEPPLHFCQLPASMLSCNTFCLLVLCSLPWFLVACHQLCCLLCQELFKAPA